MLAKAAANACESESELDCSRKYAELLAKATVGAESGL